MKLQYLLVIIVMIVLTGCSDDKYLTNEVGSELEEVGDYKVSSFTLSNEVMGADESLRDATIILKSEEGLTMEYPAEIDVKNPSMKCRMRIPIGDKIPDGKYLLSIRLADGTKLGGRVTVVFKNEMLHETQGTVVEYTKLSGEGTEDNPYLIKSKDDFSSLINNLRRDSVAHGAGRYFRQTATFNAPTQSELYDGRGYYNYGFAGIYDGGGFAIENLYYIGSKDQKKDCGIGLFAQLYDGAEIKNLRVNAVNIQNTAGDCGAIAGKASGAVKISNVKVNGNITQGGYRCGGLIGSLSGRLTVYNYDLNLSISGDNEVGGVLGQAFGTSVVNIHHVTTADHRFSVSGVDNVGGLVGRVNGEFHIGHVELEHTVSSEDKDLKIIIASGMHQGGAIGFVEKTSTTCSLDSILIECPVGGTANDVGGIIGRMESSNNVSVNYCRMTSLVSGNTSVGGLFGYVNMDRCNMQFYGEENQTRVVTDESAGGVMGESQTGGLCGYFEGNMEQRAWIAIATNVTGSGNCTGGVFGKLVNAEVIFDRINMTSENMKVQGVDFTGGLVGYAENCLLDGTVSNSVDFGGGTDKSIPKPDRFKPAYIGQVFGRNSVGGLVGEMNGGELYQLCGNCTVTGSGDYIGGIIGVMKFISQPNNAIYHCTFDGTVTGSGRSRLGGIAGRVEGKGVVHYCINYGSVSGANDLGGIAGMVDYSNGIPNLDYCVNTGRINASGTSTGGVVGYLTGNSDKKEYMLVDHCANFGEVSSTSDSDRSGIGGIVGYTSTKRMIVRHSANHGKIWGSRRQHGIGGIAGSLGQDPGGANASANLEVGWCCNRGEVTSGESDNNLGGILGYQEEGGSDKHDHDSWLHDCINYGYISSDQDEDNGGILGKIDSYGYIQNCVNFGKVKYGNGVVGTRKSACIWNHDNLYYLKDSGKGWEAKEITDSNKGDQSTYSGFNFDNSWEMRNGYPALRDCPFQFSSFSR